MKHQVGAAMPPCFENWCRRFDDLFSRQIQRQDWRIYLGGLLGESERKNLTQIASNTVDGCYNSLRHFLNDAPWDEAKLNERRLEVMQQCRQTKLQQGFTLIVDDSGHRKSGNATAGVGRQYIGEIGKTDNGVVLLTTYFYDGVRKLPLLCGVIPTCQFSGTGQSRPKVCQETRAGAAIDRQMFRAWLPTENHSN